MRLTHLKVNNFRAFEQAEFDFKPGMNLLVGVNGAGKSSVLDLLRILLSRVLAKSTKSKAYQLPLNKSDFAIGSRSMTAQVDFVDDDIREEVPHSDYARYGATSYEPVTFTFLLHKNAEQFAATKQQGNVRSQTFDLPDLETLRPENKELLEKLKGSYRKPLAIFYSTRRSIPTLAKQTKQNDELLSRDLSLREFAQWWLVQEERSQWELSRLSGGQEESLNLFAKRHKLLLSLMEAVVENFLEGCRNLRAVSDPEPTILVDKGKTILDVRQLSDGERGVMALAFDLARRIADANSYSNNVLEEGEAIVLIDEIDLHLHPRWQREIVQKLTQTFPKCQFIATTHSPQVVGEVAPENITILEAGKPPYRPDQALGMDTNWILEFLMDTRTRNEETQQELNHISDLIEEQKYEDAQAEIDRLSDDKLARDPELIKLQTMVDRLKILRDGAQEK